MQQFRRSQRPLFRLHHRLPVLPRRPPTWPLLIALTDAAFHPIARDYARRGVYPTTPDAADASLPTRPPFLRKHVFTIARLITGSTSVGKCSKNKEETGHERLV